MFWATAILTTGGFRRWTTRAAARRASTIPRLGKIILARLREGQTIRQVCADAEMPSAATLHRWRRMHPAFGAAYERMRAARAAHERMMARVTRERWLEWARIEHKIGRRRTRSWVSGAKSTYERAWAEAFCARVAKGEAVYRICADPQMPSSKAVYGWLRRHPEFEAMYMAAKREAVAWLSWRAQMTADRALNVVSASQFAAVRRRVAQIEGRIGRLQARTYR